MTADCFRALAERIVRQDYSALEEIYSFYGKKIKWAAFNVTGDWGYSEDVLSEVLIKLWNKAGKFKNVGAPDAFIYKLSKLTAIDYYRAKLKKHKAELRLEGLTRPPAYNDSYTETGFSGMLRPLDAEAREIVIMKIKFGFTYKEIAGLLKIPPGTASWKYGEALVKLRKAWAGD